MDFKLITSDEDVSQSHNLFEFCPGVLTIDRSVDSLFGAFDSKRLVGLTSGTPGRKLNKRILRSKFLVVDPDYRHQGIGFELKQLQRSWALNHGYKSIVSTINPFELSLARFCFHDLGVTANAFHQDGGGESYNSILDDLEVVWRLKGRRVKSQAAKKGTSDPHESQIFALEVGEQQQPVIHPTAFETGICGLCCVEIPLSLNEAEDIPSTTDEAWFHALRETLTLGFQKKYSITNFEIEGERCWYVLTGPQPWFLYVVECRDHTLYTGITPDLDHRLKAHNAGRGAQYTATRTPVQYVATWKYPDRNSAMRAELAFKRLSRERKLQHINAGFDFCGAQFLSDF